MMSTFARWVGTGVVIACGITFAGCGDGTGLATGEARILLAGDGSAAPSTAPSGLRLSVGDVPLTAVGTIDITVTRVDVHRTGGNDGDGSEEGDGGGGWISLTLGTETPLDLMTLSTASPVELAQGTVPAGHYNQVRLFFSTATLTLTDPITVGALTVDPGVYDLTIPSAAQSGLKIQMGRFEVPSGGTETAVLELATDASVQTLAWNANGFQMSPVMHQQ